MVWTRSGRGIVHEETPLGNAVRGLQIYVKLPRGSELTSPKVFHKKTAAKCNFGSSSGLLVSGQWLNHEQVIDSLSSFFWLSSVCDQS
ncbi:MAG: hypothetical protein CMK59_04245 [Proteobacteria bacterium]|nr:hypothetical protein [Pseudomonadota bacterium]